MRNPAITSALLHLWLLLCLTAATAAAESEGGITDRPRHPPALWVAGTPGALRIPLAGGEPIELAGSTGARGLEVDLERDTLWLASRGLLSAFDLTGEPRLAVARPAIEAVHAFLVTVPADGSLWLAEGRTLSAFAAGGQQLHRLRLEREVRGLALDAGRSLLWVATEDRVAAYDPVAAAELRRLDLGPETRPRAIGVDAASGDLWLALAEETPTGGGSSAHQISARLTHRHPSMRGARRARRTAPPEPRRSPPA